MENTLSRTLEARVAQLEDRLAIIELEASYGPAFDGREGERWAGLFTHDGIYQARGARQSGEGLFVQGRTALSKFCRTAPFDGLHLLHLPHVAFDGDRATSRVHLEFLGRFHDDDVPAMRMMGYYDVAYVRVDGRWMITRRVTTTFARNDLSGATYLQSSGLAAEV